MPTKRSSTIIKILIYLAAIFTLAACAPKNPVSMSEEDLQTCDENAWQDDPLTDNYDLFIDTHPYLALPGDVDLWSPLSGTIIPYGEAVVIKFDQPTATDGVLFRNYRVIVTSLTRTNLEYVGNEYAVVGMGDFYNEVTWMPPGSGKYIIHVFLRNLETLDWLLGNPVNYSQELAHVDTYINTGPFSVAHVCVQIDVPHAGDVVNQQMGTIIPNTTNANLFPTLTRTLTITPFTPTLTSTLTYTPTLTSTLTKTPRLPTLTLTFTPTTPPAVNCSSYTDESTCRANDCLWEQSPTHQAWECKDK